MADQYSGPEYKKLLDLEKTHYSIVFEFADYEFELETQWRIQYGNLNNLNETR